MYKHSEILKNYIYVSCNIIFDIFIMMVMITTSSSQSSSPNKSPLSCGGPRYGRSQLRLPNPIMANPPQLDNFLYLFVTFIVDKICHNSQPALHNKDNNNKDNDNEDNNNNKITKKTTTKRTMIKKTTTNQTTTMETTTTRQKHVLQEFSGKFCRSFKNLHVCFPSIYCANSLSKPIITNPPQQEFFLYFH